MKPTKETVKMLLTVIVFTSLVVWGLIHLQDIGGFFAKIFVILSPVLAGLCLAFVINELLRPMETLWNRIAKILARLRQKRAERKALAEEYPDAVDTVALPQKKARRGTKIAEKLRRPISLTICYILVIGIVAAVILIVIPELKNTVALIGESLPAYGAQIEKWIADVTALCERHDITLPEPHINFTEIGQKVVSYLTSTENSVIARTLNATTSIVNGIVNGCLALVFSIYVLAQKEAIGRHTDRILYALLPEKIYARITSLAHLTARTFSNVITGQLIEAVIIGALCFIGMTIFRMPYAAPIAVLVGSTALIPVFGAFIGTAIGAFLILFNSPIKALWFVVFIIVLQQLEGNLIYPRVVGQSVGLPGIWVLFAVTVGGSAFGFVGMLISVPVCSVLYTLCDTYIRCRLRDKAEKKEKAGE